MFDISESHELLAAIGIENAPNRDEIVANLEKKWYNLKCCN